MTKQECAIIMAHTGICMLTGKEFNEFHKYVEYIMGRPVWTHELANEEVKNEIIENSKDDFLDLCKEAVTDGWIKCEDRLPEEVCKRKLILKDEVKKLDGLEAGQVYIDEGEKNDI